MAILPLFAVILTGFLAVRSGYVASDRFRPLGEIVLRIALPALIFLSVAAAPPGEALQGLALLAICAASLGCFAAGFLAARLALGFARGQAALIGLGMSASNSGFLGYPIVQELFGTAEAGRLLAHMMVVENLVIIPLALALASRSDGGASGLRSLLRDLTRNPLVLALSAALALRVLGFSLLERFAATLELLARMSAPAALLVVGATLATLRPAGQFAAVTLVIAGKIVLHPALTLVALAAVPSVSAQFAMGAVIFAAMPMISVYPILCLRDGISALAATSLLATTVLSILTIPAWFAVVLAQ
jgi:predicted permease